MPARTPGGPGSPVRRPQPSGTPDSDRILQGLTTAVVALDADLLVTRLNSAAEHLLGVSRQLAAGRPLDVFFDP